MSKSFIDHINQPMTMSMFARKEDMLTAAMEDRASAADLLNEMLKALKDAREELEEYELAASGEDYNNPRLNAAIAKAEGK